MRVERNLLARILVPAVALAAVAFARPGARAGTELGNARFAEYAKPSHGIVFRYPEEWNVIDLGDAVSVVGNAPVGAGESVESMESVELFFDTSGRYPTFTSFERQVRVSKPWYHWRPTLFQGRRSLAARTSDRVHVMVLKDGGTVMRVSYPLDPLTDLPPTLVRKTVDSLSFLD